MTASAVLTGFIQASPVAAADPAPEVDDGLYRNSIGSDRRLDRCFAAVALHVGGPLLKAKAIEGLTGTEQQLNGIVHAPEWWNPSPLSVASKADQEAAGVYSDMSWARQDALTAANHPYASSVASAAGLTWHAPKFGEDLRHFTVVTQKELAYRLGEVDLSVPSAEAMARAKVVAEENNGKDQLHDWAADRMLRFSNVGWTANTSSDIAAYLKRGGFPTVAPVKGTPEYRVEVEDLKQAWAGCDYQNPWDPSRKLNEPLMTAMVEWEQEYAGQAGQRATIMRAEADASAAAREATDDLIEAIGQAWLADQILKWSKFWRDRIAQSPGYYTDEPDKAKLDKADADLAQYRANVAALVTSAKAQSAKAATAAQSAVTAQQAAWSVADTAQVPRGRGLMYAQQSVQVARASAAAAAAATKATETALASANATVATSAALLAKAQTESHAIDAEFRRVAAQEAAAQAKAAADTAEANATAATESANTAKAAQTTAEEKRDKAKTAATTAAAERAKAQAEQATATASRAKAATERAKAKAAEDRATTHQTTARTADTAAETATADATAKRKVADEKAKAAQGAREKSIAALQAKQATAARAAALEAAATAAEGSAAAAETRAAATAARTAANQATTAATAAQTAAA
ncbi:polymorphic toxin type 27 domain-containing protein, partial [Streptomyces sp. NPDC055721]